MGLARLVIILLIAAAGYWFWRRLRASSTARKIDNEQQDARSFVECHECRVHVLKDRALHKDGEWFCSKQHLEKHRNHHD